MRYETFRGCSRKILKSKKGFLYAVEGVIASLILLGYVSQFAVLPIQKTDWPAATLSQQGREFLAAVDASGLDTLIALNQASQFEELARFFLGSGLGFSLTTEGLFKPEIDVGVLINESDSAKVLLQNGSCPPLIQSESTCKFPATPWIVNLTVVDNDTNGHVDFDSVWIDLNNNNIFEANEGPFVLNQIFMAGNNYYTIGAIAPNGSYISFWNSRDVKMLETYFKNLDFSLNERDTTFRFSAVRPRTSEAFSSGLNQTDLLFIFGLQNLSSFRSELNDMLELGKGIIEMVNFTSSAQIDSIQKEIFGLNWSAGASASSASFRKIRADIESSDVLRYFTNAPVKALSFYDMPDEDSDENGVLDISGYGIGTITSTSGTYYQGKVELKRINWTFLLVDSSAPNIYDRVYIDSDSNGNFSGETRLKAGDSITLAGNKYTIKSIDPSGKYFEWTPSATHTLSSLEGKNVAPATAEQSIILNNSASALATANFVKGKAVWVTPDILQTMSKDELATLRSILIWTADNKHEFIREKTTYSTSALANLVAILDRDMLQPYAIYMRIWYQV